MMRPLALGVLTIALVVQMGNCVDRKELRNEEVYTFQNLATLGFLTLPLGKEIAVTADWINVPGQLWQVSKAYLSTTYLLKPMSEGLNAKVSMEPVQMSGMLHVRKVPYSVGLADGLYWSMVPAGGNLTQIQNVGYGTCMENMVKGGVVFLSQCRGANTQLWAAHPRAAEIRV